jgi:hypothetical protein
MNITRKTEMNYQFPFDTCVVACSGPSLNKVDVRSLGLPVCAISTAIRSIPEPDYWFIADHLNEMHGEEGKTAWNDGKIIKVVPNKTLKSPGNSVIQHQYNEGREANRYYETLLFDPTKPLLRGPHKTLTFAIQWLHVCGVKNIIFAGNDLEADSFDTKYSYQLQSFDRRKQHNFKKTLDQIKDALVKWYPVAQSKGYNWYSWECGSVFESFVPKYEASIEVKKNNTPTIVYSDSVQKIRKEVEKREEMRQLNEVSRNRREYRRMMQENKMKKIEREKTNMGVYFDLLHKRKK